VARLWVGGGAARVRGAAQLCGGWRSCGWGTVGGGQGWAAAGRVRWASVTIATHRCILIALKPRKRVPLHELEYLRARLVKELERRAVHARAQACAQLSGHPSRQIDLPFRPLHNEISLELPRSDEAVSL
jgi:hypothetical protein